MSMASTVGEIKNITALIPSGAGTSSGVPMQGYRSMTLLVPLLTSAMVEFIAPGTASNYHLFRDKLAGAYSALTPGGTGGMWLGSDALAFLAGHNGEVRISAAAAQAQDSPFVWQLKG